MDIKNLSSVTNLDKSAYASKQREVKKTEAEIAKKDEAASTEISGKSRVVSDVEMEAILENLNSADSKVADVEKAEEMIRKANLNILAQKDDAVLSQANQTKDVVEKLTR